VADKIKLAVAVMTYRNAFDQVRKARRPPARRYFGRWFLIAGQEERASQAHRCGAGLLLGQFRAFLNPLLGSQSIHLVSDMGIELLAGRRGDLHMAGIPPGQRRAQGFRKSRRQVTMPCGRSFHGRPKNASFRRCLGRRAKNHILDGSAEAS
jgi:hypothetical protein